MNIAISQENGSTIAIISNNNSLTLKIRSLLEEEGYSILEVTNQEEGVAACIQHSPDLVLSGDFVSEMDAFTCCKQIRQLSSDSDLPILMITDLNNEETVKQAFESGVTDCINEPTSKALLLGRINSLIASSQTLKEIRQQQFKREQLIWNITERIRQFLDIEEIFQAAVTEVRKFLECERVLFYQVLADGSGSGQVVASAVVPGCPSLLGENTDDTCFRENYLKLYRKGHIRVIDDTDDADLVPCYAELLKNYNVRANLVVPILQGDSFWGLVIAQNCTAPRHWHSSEIELLQYLSSQISIALNQAQHLQTIEASLETEKELNELKSRFFSMTSHDIRVPLSTVLTSAELLEHFGENFPIEKKIKHLQRIQLSAKKVNRILDEARSVIKDITRNLTFNPKPIDLLDFCQALVEETRTNTTPEYTIVFQHKGYFSRAVMDEQLLDHLLTNLMDNAIKYSPQGGLVLFELTREENQVIFRIQDSGIGIPKEEKGNLFNYSYRASNVGNILGTGLGLAMVKNCVDLHQGTISVESELGKGTTFTVTLPFTSSPTPKDRYFNVPE